MLANDHGLPMTHRSNRDYRNDEPNRMTTLRSDWVFSYGLLMIHLGHSFPTSRFVSIAFLSKENGLSAILTRAPILQFKVFMNKTHRFSPFTRFAALVVSALSFAACVVQPEDLDLVGVDESTDTTEGGVAGAMSVGTKLIATTNVNLRASASTSGTILDVVASGAEVIVKVSSPTNGFYKVEYNGTIGWSSGKYYKQAPTPPVASTEPTDAPSDLVALLTNCQQLAGTTKFAKDSGGSKTVPLCKLNGAIWWSADLDVDCDGGKGAACKADPYYQAETSTVDSLGNPLDASTLPFAVIPLPSNGFDYKAHGLKMGSVVGVIYQGKIMYGIIGDAGPTGVIGEASYAMAQKLGINPSPISGGVDSGVTYVAFTGTSAVVTKKEDAAQAAAIGASRAAAIVQSN
jgi:Fungal chitosanase of glycosyl hydrolase group 75/Bacterial SH3 domain